jgi:hypothetical protein
LEAVATIDDDLLKTSPFPNIKVLIQLAVPRICALNAAPVLVIAGFYVLPVTPINQPSQPQPISPI